MYKKKNTKIITNNYGLLKKKVKLLYIYIIYSKNQWGMGYTVYSFFIIIYLFSYFLLDWSYHVCAYLNPFRIPRLKSPSPSTLHLIHTIKMVSAVTIRIYTVITFRIINTKKTHSNNFSHNYYLKKLVILKWNQLIHFLFRNNYVNYLPPRNDGYLDVQFSPNSLRKIYVHPNLL